ncbi:MAG: DUF1800 domain-containing protein [Saprospiraceae bacterium]|nr:DUF1800 domain-containing protein [Saprospiraceae bacterium]
MKRADFLKSILGHTDIIQQKEPVEKKFQNKETPEFSRLRSGLAEYSGPWEDAQRWHLLKRTITGPTILDLKSIRSLSLNDTLELLLNESDLNPSPPLNYYQEEVADPDVPFGETWVNEPQSQDNAINGRRTTSFRAWLYSLHYKQPLSILENMCFFWHNHFPIERASVNDPGMMYLNYVTMRGHALGNFRDMVKAVTIDPGMLIYLNGQRNTKAAPDENYARELQELFMVGKGPESQYTEDDIHQAAKVLTGWRVNRQDRAPQFSANQHDTTNKQFSAFYNNHVIQGKTGPAGAGETDELIDMILQQNEVALFICRKLYKHFIYYTIDQQAEQEIIVPLAELFRDNNYEIKPVIKALLHSEHFHDALNHGCYIKTPLQATTGFSRQAHVTYPDRPDLLRAVYRIWNVFFTRMQEQQLELYNPPNVAGWPAFYQAPQFYQLWINATTLPYRSDFLQQLTDRGVTQLGLNIRGDAVAIIESLDNPFDPNLLVKDLCAMLLGVPISTDHQTYIKSLLLSGQADDSYWTEAWIAYVNNPGPDTLNAVSLRLKAMLQYIVSLPEFHLS